MDGFKTLPKMQHFKEGGHAKTKEMCGGGKAYKKGGEVGEEDLKQDKAMIKKAFKQHDEAEHDKEPTEIKLKTGGRSKKAKGTVRKYKDGGSVTNVYEAKKSSGDLDNIKKTKDIKPGKAEAPSKASEKPNMKGSDVSKEKSKPSGHEDPYIKSKESGKSADAPSGAKGGPNKYKTGGGVKKMQAGSLTGRLSDYVMGSPAQNAKAKKEMADYLRAKQMQQAAGQQMSPGENMAMGLAGLGQNQTPQQPAPTQQPVPTTMPQQKRGGRAGKRK